MSVDVVPLLQNYRTFEQVPKQGDIEKLPADIFSRIVEYLPPKESWIFAFLAFQKNF